jgi:hypothetical protein
MLAGHFLMPIFISYSSKDSDFVDRLAAQLVHHKVNVWIDRWEMHVGESLLDRIQEAIQDASALLVVLSPDSVESEWCKKELNSGLIRELEERRIVVLPVLIRSCEIPLFLREKLYADFRTDFDSGLRAILESVAKVTNKWRNRLVEPKFHTDWAIDWFTTNDGTPLIRLTLVESVISLPFTVLSVISILPLGSSCIAWYTKMTANQQGEDARMQIIESLSGELSRQNFRVVLEDQFEKTSEVLFSTKHGDFLASISTRWLGADTGRDLLMNVSQQVEGIMGQMKAVSANSTSP